MAGHHSESPVFIQNDRRSALLAWPASFHTRPHLYDPHTDVSAGGGRVGGPTKARTF